MRPDLIEKYDLRVPRYTSYPTAPHFAPTVGADTYARWLGALEVDTPLSLYLHIPYCAEMCWFCGCHTKATHKYAPVGDYLAALWEEMRLVAAALPGRMRVDHVHFGGGSPTLLTAEDFTHTLAELRLLFDVTAEADIAVELDPRTAKQAYIEAMATAGVTRASIGVQDFDERVQRVINRIQPYDVTAQVVTWLRAAGIDAINMDLVYGLPYQTVESVIDMAEKTVEIEPARVALFGYAHVPWMKPHQKLIPEAALPDMAERWAQYEAASNVLKAAGYVTVGLDHFAHPADSMARAARAGTLHRNFQGYTTDEAAVLIGLGASGIGSLPQGYVANEVAIDGYKRRVQAGELPIARGIEVTDEDRLRRAIIERLMCDLRVDLDAISGAYGRNEAEFGAELIELERLAGDGLVTVDGRCIAITEEGRPLMRAVCAVFDTYLAHGTAKHSQAV